MWLFNIELIEARYANLLFPPTARGAALILQILGYSVQIDPILRHMGNGSFEVEIASGCLGYQGMSVALIVLSTCMYIKRGSLRLPQAFAIFPVVLTLLFMTNVLRLSVL